MSNIEIIELSEISKKKRTVITGFAGVGSIGNTALMHIVRAKDFKQVAYIHGNILPPLMILVDGKPKHGFRIYIDARDELMFIVSEAMISTESAWTVGQELIKWLKKKGINEIITLEGFPSAQTQKNVFGFTTSGKNLQDYDVNPLREGAISGVNASLLDEVMKTDIHWTSIFIPTRIINTIDYQGAAATVNVINKIFKMNIDTTPLIRISEAITRAARSQQQPKKGGLFGRIFPGEVDV